MNSTRTDDVRRVRGLSVTKLEWPRLLHGAPISAGAFRVAMVVWDATNGDGTGAFLGNRRISEAACMSVSQVKRNLGELVDSGWLVREEIGGTRRGNGSVLRRASVYRLGSDSAISLPRRTDAPGVADAPGGADQGRTDAPGPGALVHRGARRTDAPTPGASVTPHQTIDQTINHQTLDQRMSAMGSPTSMAPQSRADEFVRELRSRLTDATDPEIAEGVQIQHDSGHGAYQIAGYLRTQRRKTA